MTDNFFSPTQLIRSSLNRVVQDFGLDIKAQVEHPNEESHGDYASNIALVTITHLKDKYQNPRGLAQDIKAKILKQKDIDDWCQKIEIAGPGFLNFFLKDQILIDELEVVTKKNQAYGNNQNLKGKKVMCEYTDPNPFKEFHIGHLYSNTVGESLARILEAFGAQVKRANYFGDVGMHVAKSIWGLQQKMADEGKKLEDLEKLELAEKVKYLGQAYALGATTFEEDEEATTQIKDLNKLIYKQDPSITKIYQTGKKWSLDYFDTIYQRLGTKFDFYLPESEVGPLGLAFVKDQVKKGVFVESDGAIVFPGDKYGLHTRVFVNAQGLPTYEAKDLGLAPIKYEKFAYDKSIIITANEINEYFKVVLKALEQIKPELAQKTTHLGHGMVKLPEGKMSSRTGKILTGEWLLDLVKAEVVKRMKASEVKHSTGEIEQISEQVAVGAIKYAFLKSSIGKDIIFDIEESLSLQGNSGPYIQYTYARCRSVLQKSGDKNQNTGNKVFKNYKPNDAEISILRYLYRFDEVVLEAGQNYSPHLICTYLFELCQRYNLFYNKCRILQAEEKEQKEFRLLLTQAVAQVLSNGLNLLGIKAPEKM